MLLRPRMTSIIRFSQNRSSAKEVVVGEVVPSQIIQIRDSLSGRVERQRRRLRVDAEEHLLCVAKLAGLEE